MIATFNEKKKAVFTSCQSGFNVNNERRGADQSHWETGSSISFFNVVFFSIQRDGVWSAAESLLQLITSGWSFRENSAQISISYTTRQKPWEAHSTMDFQDTPTGNRSLFQAQACHCTIFQEWLCTFISTQRVFDLNSLSIRGTCVNCTKTSKLFCIKRLQYVWVTFRRGNAASVWIYEMHEILSEKKKKKILCITLSSRSPLGSFQVAWWLLSTNCKTKEFMNHSSHLAWHTSPLDYSRGKPEAFDNSIKPKRQLQNNNLQDHMEIQKSVSFIFKGLAWPSQSLESLKLQQCTGTLGILHINMHQEGGNGGVFDASNSTDLPWRRCTASR